MKRKPVYILCIFAAIAVLIYMTGESYYSGITKKAAALCTQQIIIPMDGRAESLNASVAASIIMYEMSRKV